MLQSLHSRRLDAVTCTVDSNAALLVRMFFPSFDELCCSVQSVLTTIAADIGTGISVYTRLIKAIGEFNWEVAYRSGANALFLAVIVVSGQ